MFQHPLLALLSLTGVAGFVLVFALVLPKISDLKKRVEVLEKK